MDPPTSIRTPWHQSTLSLALIGSLLMWMSLPPLAFGWLAWIAPVPWLLLIRAEHLPGRRPYRALWVAGFAFWMATLHWLRLPHPAVSIGWIALSAYLGIYSPLFVGLSRVGVHRVRMPLWVAAPLVWVGLEFARAHFMTGFLLASLAHTQVERTALIQVSDLVGEYGVSFLVMAVAACIACVAFPPREMWAAAPAGVLLAAALGYGSFRMQELIPNAEDGDAPQTVRIALIQGNSLAEWKQDPNRERQIMDEYLALSDRAIQMARERGDRRLIDLFVWPETMFRTRLVSFDAGYQLPHDIGRTKDEIANLGPSDFASLVRRLGAPVLVGVERVHFVYSGSTGHDPPPARRYNAAVLVNRDGKIAGTYDKVHRVLFGEYIPFAELFPGLYRLTPLTGGIEAGQEPAILESDGWFYAPSICYETVLPHVIRRQAAKLAGGSVPPDVLVNLTNDAWYWGSSALDLHLACGVFRAVETRTSLVIAANGGLSAWIDQVGRIRAQSTRQQPEVILADVERGAPVSWYVQWGDWFAAGCLTCCILLAIIGWYDRRPTR